MSKIMKPTELILVFHEAEFPPNSGCTETYRSPKRLNASPVFGNKHATRNKCSLRWLGGGWERSCRIRHLLRCRPLAYTPCLEFVLRNRTQQGCRIEFSLQNTLASSICGMPMYNDEVTIWMRCKWQNMTNSVVAEICVNMAEIG